MGEAMRARETETERCLLFKRSVIGRERERESERASGWGAKETGSAPDGDRASEKKEGLEKRERERRHERGLECGRAFGQLGIYAITRGECIQ